MISQRLIEKFQELEEKRFVARRENPSSFDKFYSHQTAVKHWNRIFVMYCNPNWKASQS